MIPMHYESWENTMPEFPAQVFRDMNHIMEERGLAGRVSPLERTRWYTLDLCIRTTEYGFRAERDICTESLRLSR